MPKHRGVFFNANVADVKLGRNAGGKTIIAEHRDPCIDTMPMAGQLAFCDDYGAVRPRRDNQTGGFAIIDGFEEYVALGVNRIHEFAPRSLRSTGNTIVVLVEIGARGHDDPAARERRCSQPFG
jgi:hypothetical protein